MEAVRELIAATLADPKFSSPNADEMAANVLWRLDQEGYEVVACENQG